MIRKKCIIIYILVFFFVSFSFINVFAEPNHKYNILIDLDECKLYLLETQSNELVKTYRIAGGKPSTPSPIGTWRIIYKDKWDKGFGTRWMQLSVPWGKYGIHGTNKPLTIGGSISLGCIRMLNSDVEELYDMVDYGTAVTIYGGPYDMMTYKFRDLIPGDRGADVFEVQRKLQDIGYFNGKIDGIYGEDLKVSVIKYRKDHKLSNTHNIDLEFYNAVGIKPFE